MVSLTPNQLKTLRKMVLGTTEKLDGRIVNALQRRHLVKNNHATTSGWHAVGEMRYTPEIKIPCDWEVDTWKDCVLSVVEVPEFPPQYNNDRTPRWTHAKEREYQFNIHEIMKFYQEVRIAQSQWVNAKWDEGMDHEYKNELKYGWSGNNVPWRDRIVLNGEEEALANVSIERNLYYTGELFFRWADALYKTHVIEPNRLGVISYKFSLQDNEDEHRKFWSNYTERENTWITAYVAVD